MVTAHSSTYKHTFMVAYDFSPLSYPARIIVI